MATTVRASDSIDVLDLPIRPYGALRRNHILTVGELCQLSEAEFLRFRGVGEGTLRDLRAVLASHGLSMPIEEPPAPDPAITAVAEWIGQQLDALAEDERVVDDDKGRLFAKDTGISHVERRRLAWAFYRWGLGGMQPEDWPRDKEGGRRWMAHAMPGSLELHLAGLNQVAHQELGE